MRQRDRPVALDGDGPGGTADLVRRAEAVSGRKAEIINPHNLAGGSEGGHD